MPKPLSELMTSAFYVQKASAFLRDRLFAESDRAGGDRLRAAGDGTFLRRNRALGCRAWNFDNRPSGRTGNGFDL